MDKYQSFTQESPHQTIIHSPIQQKNDSFKSPQGQKPPIQSKQTPVQSAQGQKPPIQAKQKPIQRQQKTAHSNNSRLDESQIKANVSALTGTDVSDAQVTYNSGKPAQLQAEATAQGSEVHLAPGKEQHLGHELTHIAQQKQGRVQTTVQANNGVGINNDPRLEKEADDIGAKASQGVVSSSKEISKGNATNHHVAPVQRYVIYDKQDQFRHLSEEDYNTVNTHQKDARPYSEKMKKKYDKQTEKFDKKYKKQEAKGAVSSRYKKQKEGWRHPQRKTLFVSNDGKMAVENVTTTDPNTGTKSVSKQAWADQSLISKANQVLQSKDSYVKLVTEASDLVVGSVPGSSGTNPSKGSFKKIKAIHTDAKPKAKDQDMTEAKNTENREYGVYNSTQTQDSLKALKLRDCGNANRLIMGCIQEDGSFTNRVYKSKDGAITLATADPTKTIQTYIQKVMQAEFPAEAGYSDKKTAYEAYKKLGSAEKTKIDEKYGLNISARPTLGQGVTMVASEYDKNATGYNYHFATNIMQSDDKGDYMALEGLADHPVWYFSMYGTQKGESFDERQDDTVQKPHISTIVDKQ